MEFFKDVSKIKFEGVNSKNLLAFRYYEADKMILGKPMKEHLRFAMSYWHTLTGSGVDMFGDATMKRGWDNSSPIEKSKARVIGGFEIMEKLGIEYFCFHDKDIAPEGESLKEYQENLDIIVESIEKEIKRTGIKLLWGTSNMFTHPRFMHGASTSPEADVFAYAAAQTKKAMDITNRLNGKGYVFWGGREGYETLLNTDMGFEQDNLARFLKMAVDYAKEIGFSGQFYIEPKPKEPTKHQYDFDAATVLSFLRKYNLDKNFKLNIEANHATLAGHTFHHELYYARINDALGSVDANQGDSQLGWDTDQFPSNVYDATLAMYEILKMGGFKTGGLNFDAKLRRGSVDGEDIFHAYISGMDIFAKGLIIAEKLLTDKVIESFIEKRYSSYQTGIGKDIVAGKVGFKELSEYAMNNSVKEVHSGKQEMLENILNRYVLD
ncbi:MAG: xylose isomerase [Fusobacteriaceae bacterium]